MDPVYQDEAILGFQQRLGTQWSWGVRGIYRRLHNAIDDMNITATPQCGGDGYIGYVMANPGRNVTVWGDTNCDGNADGYVTIDTSKYGFALYDADGNYLGQRGWVKPKRTYGAIELQLDRAWDEKWSFNASYTASWNRGNAEGPVDSDTNFDDTGRTENFDDPFVNLQRWLPAQRPAPPAEAARHLCAHPELAGSGQSGRPFGRPDHRLRRGQSLRRNQLPQLFHLRGTNCRLAGVREDRVYEASPRGRSGRLPWTYTLDASITYVLPFNDGKMRVKLTVFNLLNQQRKVQVDQDLQTDIGDVIDANGNDTGIGALNATFLQPIGFQAPRYVQLTFSADF